MCTIASAVRVSVKILVEPGMLEALSRRGTRFWVLAQHELKQLKCGRADLLECGKREVGLLVHDLGRQFTDVFVKERLHATKHHVQHDAGAPNVDFIVVASGHFVELYLEHLGRNILHYARIRLHLVLLGVELSRNVEVEQQKAVRSLLNQQVLRLDVSVHNVVGMQVSNALQKLPEVVARLLLRVRVALGDVIEQLEAFDVFHDQVLHTTLFAHEVVMHLHNVPVVQLAQYVVLALRHQNGLHVERVRYLDSERIGDLFGNGRRRQLPQAWRHLTVHVKRFLLISWRRSRFRY